MRPKAPPPAPPPLCCVTASLCLSFLICARSVSTSLQGWQECSKRDKQSALGFITLSSRFTDGDTEAHTDSVSRELLCPSHSEASLTRDRMNGQASDVPEKALGAGLRPAGAAGRLRLSIPGRHLGLGPRDHAPPRHGVPSLRRAHSSQLRKRPVPVLAGVGTAPLGGTSRAKGRSLRCCSSRPYPAEGRPSHTAWANTHPEALCPFSPGPACTAHLFSSQAPTEPQCQT